MQQNSQEVIPTATTTTEVIPTMEVASASLDEPSLMQDALETTVNTQLLPTKTEEERGLRRYFCFCCYFFCVFLNKQD